MSQDFLIQDIKRAETSEQVDKVLRHKAKKPMWREYLETAIIALVAAVLLRVFVVSAFRVTSGSMEGSLFEGDYIFVNQMAYDFGNMPQNDDIVVFKYPNNPKKDFIKRIVASPGQTVQVADKILYVDGEVAPVPTEAQNIDKRIIPGDLSYRDNFGPYTVPEGQFFVMGDNRDDSRDSRFWGSVPEEMIHGKAVFVYWSWKPNPDAPEWEFPYVVEAVQWIGYGLYNLPSSLRLDRIGRAL